MSKLITLGFFPLMYLIELIYLQFAIKYRIIPRQQDQSRRNRIVTGAGIIFPIAFLLFFALNDFVYPTFTVVLLFVAIISMLHDVAEMPKIVLFSFLFIALYIILFDAKIITQFPFWLILLIFLLSFVMILTIRAMDGINGMIGLMGIVVFGSIILCEKSLQQIDLTNPVYYVLVSLLAFGFFNFRIKAQAFAGTTGRNTLAFLIIFFMLQLIFGRTSMMDHEMGFTLSFDNIHPQYLMFVSVYLLDFIYTFIKRISSRLNPFRSHKDYVYHQLIILTHKPPIYIAFLYAFLQLTINLIVVFVA